MAQLIINIPDNKVDLVLKAFAARRGINKSQSAFKTEIISEIKSVVKWYETKEAAKSIQNVDVS